MKLFKNNTAFVIAIYFLFSCNAKLKEEDKIFHAGPSESGIGGTFFSLYKNNKYEFCDGNFLFPGCYTGNFQLKGDTIILENLKLNEHVKNNRFIIYRFSEQDSVYWKTKYPDIQATWTELRGGDFARGIEGDIYELDKNNTPIIDVRYWYVIRLDKIKR